MEFDRRSRLRPRLSVAPLVDVVFLLLIFFLLTSSYEKSGAMQLDLPRAQSARPVGDSAITVSLAADGSTRLNGRQVAGADLKAELELLLSADQAVLLRADRTVAVAELVRVMDSVRQAGGRVLSLATGFPVPAGGPDVDRADDDGG
ncbi:MAG TPA: biopolymer transporter ExbD [Deltaproteobacteria bacterium]|nr:biopolymer transporter ExbD [Candidatus Binatota bacterium]HIL14216.1 biopolymer transporter ExbD [Deltaproteobacteria bacterium]